MNALIVGAGVAGPVTAMALQQVGIEATIFESHPPSDGELGSYFTVTANGLEGARRDRGPRARDHGRLPDAAQRHVERDRAPTGIAAPRLLGAGQPGCPHDEAIAAGARPPGGGDPAWDPDRIRPAAQQGRGGCGRARARDVRGRQHRFRRHAHRGRRRALRGPPGHRSCGPVGSLRRADELRRRDPRSWQTASSPRPGISSSGGGRSSGIRRRRRRRRVVRQRASPADHAERARRDDARPRGGDSSPTSSRETPAPRSS